MGESSDEAMSAAALVESWKPYFVAEYERDSCNRPRQTFDEYWGWVKSLLPVGGSGYAGWLAQTAAAAAKIGDPTARRRVGALAQEIGCAMAFT